MLKRSIGFLFSLILIHFSSHSNAQILKNILGNSNTGPIPSNEVLLQNLRTDLEILAQPKFDGRKLGTEGYVNVTGHIEKRMQQLGLIRYGSVGYRGVYKYPVGRKRTVDSKFYVDGKSLFIGDEVLPLDFCATKDVSSHIVPRVNGSYSPWTLALPNANINAKNIESILKPLIINAQDRGASAIYFYDEKGSLDLKALNAQLGDKIDADIEIPVWIISKNAWEKYFKDVYSLINVESVLRYKTTFKEGYNVVGLIDNGAAKTIFITADYDQLFDTENFQGANANASGVAILLQLAQILKDKSFVKYNYAFACFSGARNGQMGVNSLLTIPGIKPLIAYSIDLTALGNLSKQNEIFINGITTSNGFRSAIKAASEICLPKIGDEYPYQASYLKLIEGKIPTLSFSSGFKNYDSKADNINRINYDGMASSIRFIIEVMNQINNATYTPAFVNNPLLVRNEDLVIIKNPPPVPVAKNSKDKSVNNEKVKSDIDKKSTSQKVEEAKARLANSNKVATPKPTVNNPIQKLPVEETYVGSANVVIDSFGLGINELDEREGGALIQSVAANSKGAALGLSAGDVVMQIGSIPVYNAKGYLITMKRFKQGEKAYYKVKKTNGKTVMLFVEF